MPPDPAVLLGAVREDIRQTLRTGWIDPVLEAAAASPAFLTAAWSAVRPNVSKSFLLLSRAVRTEAGDSARATLSPPDLRRRLHSDLSEEEFRRAEESVRAAHLAMAKVQIVSHILYRAVRRERLGGTGREEPPVRRGVPDQFIEHGDRNELLTELGLTAEGLAATVRKCRDTIAVK